MAKLGYLKRAYNIPEYAYLRQTAAENPGARPDEVADTLPEVLDDVRMILEMAETVDDRQTIRQCRRFLADFGGSR